MLPALHQNLKFQSFPYYVYLKRRRCRDGFLLVVTMVLQRGVVEMVMKLQRQRRFCG